MGDYLWDKTGAADPEVERLEDLLGRMAHRPRPLELPQGGEAATRRGLRAARLAAAAALLLAVLAGALVALRQARPGGGPVAESGSPREASAPRGDAPSREDSPTPARVPEPREQIVGVEEKPSVRAAEAARRAKRSRRRPAAVRAVAGARVEVAAASRAPGEAERLQAKEQLVYALRLTSAKLGEVRRKVHGGGDDSKPAPGGRGRTR